MPTNILMQRYRQDLSSSYVKIKMTIFRQVAMVNLYSREHQNNKSMKENTQITKEYLGEILLEIIILA